VSRLSRRRFLVRAAGWAAAPWIVPARILAGPSAPSRRIGIALIGCGGMGGGHLDNLLWRKDVRVVATCDPDRDRRREAADRIAKRYGEEAASGTWRGVEDYNDFREVLARPDVDAVLIATPDHWHAAITTAAARAGKDVYCEKPASRTVREGRVMADVLARHGRVFQTGSWQRSVRDFRRAAELVRNGRIGRVVKVEVTLPQSRRLGPQPAGKVPEGFDYDLWLGPAPRVAYVEARVHYHWRWVRAYAGGGLADWGAHHLDIVQWALGTDRSGPVWIEGQGTFPREGPYDQAVEYEVRYGYPDGTVVTARDGSPHAITFTGDRGTVKVWREGFETEPASLKREFIGPGETRLYESRDHMGDWLEAIRTRGPTASPIEIAHRSATMCHLGNLAMRLGRRLAWDPARERFRNDPEADAMLDEPMRAPWRL
jgi:predicted dehydrogenase